MDSDYATLDDLKHYAYHAGVRDEVRWEDIIPRASRVIDGCCHVAPGWFRAAPQQACEQSYDGSGTRWLAIDPLVCNSIQFVEYAFSESFTPDYTLRIDKFGQHFLIAADGECWLEGDSVLITARWGWPSVPEDVKEATIELAVAMWRQRDAAYARVVTDVNGAQTIFGALPDRVKEVCLRRRSFNLPVAI